MRLNAGLNCQLEASLHAFLHNSSIDTVILLCTRRKDKQHLCIALTDSMLAARQQALSWTLETQAACRGLRRRGLEGVGFFGGGGGVVGKAEQEQEVMEGGRGEKGCYSQCWLQRQGILCP